jgi:2,3-bisphosphoglycerate-independent phosphoglycerate mutase
MSLNLKSHSTFKGRKGPVLLIVMDGVGLATDQPGNAVTQANTPVLDKLLKSKLSTQLITHGTAVGLPSDGDMGNSEVGHNALGAGRVIVQGSSLINKALESGEIFKSAPWETQLSVV